MSVPDDQLPVNALQSVLAASQRPTQHVKQRAARIVAQKAARQIESLKMYEPLPFQQLFHQDRAQQVVLQKGNRVGGTLCNMVEIARAVTGQDPHNKYPKADGRAVVLGYGEKHIGRVFYDKLFRAGAFRIIRDLATKKWRAYRPWPASEGGDLEREDQTKPAPPLIPQRFIKRISWEKKSEKVFSLVTFTTGWELHAMNSAGDPGQAQGFSVNLYAIDEDLATSGWYEEALGRIADCGGLIRWSALPHAKNDDLMQMINLADEQAGELRPVAKIVRASIFDNKYIPRDSVERSVTSWKSQGDDIYRKRAMGEIVLDSVLMYPTFNRRLHDALTERPDETPAMKILRERNGEPPNDWTRYASIDPGHTVCATIFLAVPPRELGEQIFAFDELYLANCTAEIWGEAFESKVRDWVYLRWYIDMHGGSLRSIGTGELPIEKYTEQLRRRQLRSIETEYGFYPGFDQIAKREEILRNHFALQVAGLPRLMLVTSRCPNLASELERFRKVTVKVAGKDIPTDKGNRRAHTHAIEALEQLVAHDLPYVRPRIKSVDVNFIDRFLQWREGRKQARREALGTGTVTLGPVGVNS